jgi:hypothetical protein
MLLVPGSARYVLTHAVLLYALTDICSAASMPSYIKRGAVQCSAVQGIAVRDYSWACTGNTVQ